MGGELLILVRRDHGLLPSLDGIEAKGWWRQFVDRVRVAGLEKGGQPGCFLRNCGCGFPLRCGGGWLCGSGCGEPVFHMVEHIRQGV